MRLYIDKAVTMAQQVYPPNVIVRTITDKFFQYRDLAAAPRSLIPGEVPNFDDNRVISDMEQFYYVRLDATRTSSPRGKRDWVVILVLGADGKYSQHSPDLRKLLEGVEAERAATEGRLDEVIIIADEGFFSKKNLTEVIHEFQKKQVGGPDDEGLTPFYTICHYYNFACVVPEHTSVYPHRVMSPDEVDAVLKRERRARADFPVIFTTDAPIIWNGGREGRLVEITRDSQTAAKSIYYRRIERGAI